MEVKMYAELIQNLCKKCNIVKPIKEFYDLRKENRCKSCVKIIRKQIYIQNADKIKNRVKKYRANNPEKIKDLKLKQAYGVGLDYYNAKLKEQNGVCAGCKRVFKVKWRGIETQMCLDHCHTTKKPRGILCIKCNRALGLFEENIQTLNNMIDYINKYKK